MSLRVDTSSLISGALVCGNRGLGVLGSEVPSTGDNGAGYVYNDLSLPADANKEVRGLIVTPPSAGTFFAYEDSSFEFTAPNGAYSFTYRLFVDGADLGTATVTLSVGSTPVEITCTLGTATATGYAATLSQAINVACNLGVALAEGYQAGIAGAEIIGTSCAVANAFGYLASVSIVTPLTDSEKIDLILDILSNRQELNPATGLYTLYADDGVTVLKTAYAWEDQAGTIPYRGQGLKRLDAMQ